MSFAKVEQIIAQRVANAIETIAIYETKTHMACESMNQTKQQEEKIAEDTSNKKGSRKMTIREALANNKTKSLRQLEHTLSGQATRKAMLEIYHYVTSACSTTLARVQQNVEISNGLVIKLDIVGPQSIEQNKSPQWQNRKLKLHVMSVK
nr:hypothetical protein [Tanacetum cinerariifolium]